MDRIGRYALGTVVLCLVAVVAVTTTSGASGPSATPTAPRPSNASAATVAGTNSSEAPAADAAPVGPAGYAMATATTASVADGTALRSGRRASRSERVTRSAGAELIDASYTHTPAVSSQPDLPAGSGPTMHTLTIYEVFWLPTGDHYGTSASDDTTYENLLERFAGDIGGSQYYNLVTQYYDASASNAHITDTATFGGAFVDTTTPYPHAGSTTDPLGDSDIQNEVSHAVATEGWTEDINHLVAVFTANGIQECDASGLTDGHCSFPVAPDNNGEFCAYHNWFTDGSNDAQYAFMSYDDMFHGAGQTCDAGSPYPNGSQGADSEVSTFSHETIESVTDPHPNDAWTASDGEIGDKCNFNYAPRNDIGADVYLNGHPYVVQQQYSNAVHTCAIDLPTNGFCATAVSDVCAPTLTFGKTVDDPTPEVTGSVVYTISLDDTSDTAAATNLAFTDSLPSGYVVTNVSASSSTSESSTAGSVTVDYDTLPVHQSRTIKITATVPTPAGVLATNCGGLALQDLIGTNLTSLTTNPCANTTPQLIPTTLTYTGATTTGYGQQATVSAKLVADGVNPVSGQTVTFTLNGVETCNGSTDGLGDASCPITPGEVGGTYTLDVSFTATSVYTGSSTSTPFIVTLVLTSPPLPNPTWETPYSPTISALGGSGTVTFSVTGGSLPTGLHLGTNGVFTGSATDKTQIGQTFTFTVEATDPVPASGSQTYTIKLLSPCASSLTPFFLSATSRTGNFTGFFCLNGAGVGTYAQNGGPSGTGTLSTSGGVTRITGFGKNLALLGLESGAFSTFTETAPGPEKAGTFTLV